MCQYLHSSFSISSFSSNLIAQGPFLVWQDDIALLNNLILPLLPIGCSHADIDAPEHIEMVAVVCMRFHQASSEDYAIEKLSIVSVLWSVSAL